MKRTSKWFALFFLGFAFWGVGCDNVETDWTPPPPPDQIWSVTGDHTVYLFWQPVQAPDLEGYRVYRSTSLYGYYDYIRFTEVPAFVDEGLANGVTYYYSVSSVDVHGNESQPSEWIVMDTPRPEGRNALIWSLAFHPDAAGFDLNTQRVVSVTDPSLDFYFTESYGGEPELVAGPYDLIQDVGYVDDLDEIDVAPLDGWDPDSRVRAWPGHAYVILTEDNHFAKIRIRELSEQFILFDWAFQVDPGNPELGIQSPQFTERR